MIETELNLTVEERSALREISRLTGKTEDELIREAVGQFITEFHQNRLALMRQARGVWKERDDLPAFGDLRREWDRLPF
jgi:predicted DNA-binding protein